MENTLAPMKRPFSLGRIVIVLVVAHLIAWAFLAFGQLPEDGHLLIRDGAILFLPLAALPIALRARQPFSRLLTALPILAVTGQMVWIIEHHGFNHHEEPSWAAPIWIASYALIAVAVSRWPAKSQRNFSLSFLLDTVILATGLFAAAWVYLLGPRVASMKELDLATLFHLGYVCADLVIAVALIHAVRRGVDPRFGQSTFFACAALALLAASDIPSLAGAGSQRMWGDLWALAWPGAATSICIAAYLHSRESEKPPQPVSATSSPWRDCLPYLPLPFVAAILIRVSADPQLMRFESTVKLCAVIVLGALVLRQFVALRENQALVAKLQETQADLEQKNIEVLRTNDDLTDVLGRLTEKNQELGLANEQLAQLVTVDGMTGLGNHRAFHERLRLEVEAARRFGHPLVVLLADIDHFRRYNDEFGHPAGDEVLRHVAKTLFDEVDLKAYPARYGGEEFGVVLPYVTCREAMDLAHRIGIAMATRGHLRRPVTLSFGIAGLQGNQWSAEILVQEAFRALDVAKTRGRNQIVLAEDLDRRILALSGGDVEAQFDPAEPMGLAAVLSAGLRGHPQALSIEPETQLVSGLLGTLELKDLETRDHSERVMWYALRLAQSVMEMQSARMTQQDLRSLAYGALLHDIGKIGVPEAILKFPGKLTEEMRNVIREHPRLGAQLVQKFPTLEMALPVIRFHHERWDGNGYPSGRLGRDIPLVARIFALVDALEALTSQRPYKDPMPIEAVTDILVQDSGTHFDPMIVEAYLAVPMAEWMRLREQERVVAGSICEQLPAIPSVF